MSKSLIVPKLLIGSSIFLFSALIQAQQVTVTVAPKSIQASESGDGFSFKSTDGKDYHVYHNVDRKVKGVEFISKSKSTVCLTIDTANADDITSISNGECKTTNSSATNNIVMGRCHMDVCWWWKVENTEEIQSNAKGKLVKTFVRITNVDFPSSVVEKKGYPDLPPKKAKWEDITETFIFCSNKIPAYFDYDKEQKKFVGSTFTGSYDGLTEGQENLYTYICQSKISPNENYSEISIDKPTDIFNW
jgi:hypothetical protein